MMHHGSAYGTNFSFFTAKRITGNLPLSPPDAPSEAEGLPHPAFSQGKKLLRPPECSWNAGELRPEQSLLLFRKTACEPRRTVAMPAPKTEENFSEGMI